MKQKRSNTSSAVRQQRAAKVQAADDPQTALYRLLNYFPTPPYGARVGAEILKELCPDAVSVLEPACGEGHMAVPLAEYFPDVRASDIHAHGFGGVADFLGRDYEPDSVDLVVTNPPFDKAEEFLARGLEVARFGVALLCRIAFLEGMGRFEKLYRGPHPLTLCAVFTERVAMELGNWDPDGDSATCYAWFFFIKGRAPMPIRGIPPGTKERLSKREDVLRFAKLAPAPLLDFATTS